jgi:hypothetical protein
MQYKIIETTDSQHKGATVDIAVGQTEVEMPDGDLIKIIKIKPMGGLLYKLVSFNYVAIMESVAE